MDIDDLTPEQRELLKQIQARRVVVVREHRLKKGAGNNQAIVPRRNDPRRISNTQNMKVREASDLMCSAESPEMSVAFSYVSQCQTASRGCPWGEA